MDALCCLWCLLFLDARQQDFPVDDQQCASYRWLLLCNRLRPNPHSAAPGQHQPRVSGDEPSGEGEEHPIFHIYSLVSGDCWDCRTHANFLHPRRINVLSGMATCWGNSLPNQRYVYMNALFHSICLVSSLWDTFLCLVLVTFLIVMQICCGTEFRLSLLPECCCRLSTLVEGRVGVQGVQMVTVCSLAARCH